MGPDEVRYNCIDKRGATVPVRRDDQAGCAGRGQRPAQTARSGGHAEVEREHAQEPAELREDLEEVETIDEPPPSPRPQTPPPAEPPPARDDVD